jgi:hypothetical protein
MQLPLPLTLEQVQRAVLDPAISGRFDSPEARVMLLAIGLQESRFAHRRQIGGPARGLWQFERGGGVAGVLRHPSSKVLAADACRDHCVKPTAAAVYGHLEHDDVLAAKFARLLLWTDPRPLPALGDVEGAWRYYIRNWRPGKPHRHTWNALYADALEAVRA